MSVELIGYENLPNVFIKEIKLFDYSANEMQIRVTCALSDLKEEVLWYDTSEIVAQMLKVGLIFSTNPAESESLNKGEIPPTSLRYVSKPIPYAVENEDSLVFEVSFTEMFHSSIKHLNLYAFCFIDDKQMMDTFGLTLQEDYYGPISSEKVVQNSKIVSETYMFLKQDGSPWAGPVHQTIDNGRQRWMGGSRHTGGVQPFLLRSRIPNSKIKDFRSTEKRKSIRDKEMVSQISRLLVSYNFETDINAMFMLNVKTVLMNNTKYGSFLRRASSSVINQLVDAFKMNLMTIQRIRLKPHSKSRRQDRREVFSRKNIAKSYDFSGRLRNTTRFERRKNSLDLVVSELRSNINKTDRREGEVFLEELGDYKKISMIKEVFFDYGQGIRAFQFNDYELTDRTPGTYRYKVEMHFSDPTHSFLSNIVQDMKELVSITKTYVNLKSRSKMTITNAEVQRLINSYVTYYSYVYEMTSVEKKNMSTQLFGLLDPSTAILPSIKNYERRLTDLFSEFLYFLDFDRAAFSEGNKTNIVAKNSTTARILISKEFDTLIQPSSNEVGFGYMGATTSDGMKVMSKLQFQERMDTEINRNFSGQPQSASPDRDAEVNNALNNISSRRTTYVAPNTYKNRSQSSKMGSDSSAPYDDLNQALTLRGRERRTSSRANSGISIENSQAPTQTQETLAFIESSEIIGENQEFVSYETVEDSYNVIEAQTAGQSKFNDYFSGYQNNRTFAAVLKASKNLTPEEAEELPSQLKAVIHGQSTETRTDYFTSGVDLLANPKTKNYYEVNNFSVQRIVYLDGFKNDSSGNILLNVPVFKQMLFSDFVSLSRPVICYLQAYSNDKFNISDANEIQVIDSYFIISDRDLSVKTETVTSNELPNYSMEDKSFEFMSSNIVMQTNQPITEESETNSISSPSSVSPSPSLLTPNYQL